MTNLGQEVARAFDVHENCYDCAGFYDGCPAWPAAREFACHKYHRLPDVMPGTCGQPFPDVGRKLATIPVGGRPEADPMSATGQLPQHPPRHTRRQSPMAKRGPNGERLCECGTVLPRRKRCCDDCRLDRREATMRQRGNRSRLSVVADANSDVPSTGPTGPST
jgi:hypothetical protein